MTDNFQLLPDRSINKPTLEQLCFRHNTTSLSACRTVKNTNPHSIIMAAILQKLPNVLLYMVVSHLGKTSLGNLRSTNREFGDIVAQGSHYLTLFTNRTVDLTETGLLNLERSLKSKSRLARLLSNLTLVMVSYDIDQQSHSILRVFDQVPPLPQVKLHRQICQSMTQLQILKTSEISFRRSYARYCLQQAQHASNICEGVYPKRLGSLFKTIKRECGSLRSLCLTARVQVSAKVRHTHETLNRPTVPSNDSFFLATTLDALMTSRLHVLSLDAFSTIRMCNVSCQELAAYLSSVSISKLRWIGTQSRALSLRYSVSARQRVVHIGSKLPECCQCNSNQYTPQDQTALCHAHHRDFVSASDPLCAYELGIATFLSQFPYVNTLALHEYERVRKDPQLD